MEEYVRTTEDVAYGIQIETADGLSWIDTYWRDYRTPGEAIDFADAIFTGRRNWRLVKVTTVTTVEVIDQPTTGTGS
jgi:hypothetical protein